VFPHYEVRRCTVQPDYDQWQAVAIAMTRDEVIQLLGRPLRDPYSAPRPRKEDPYYYYGYLQLPMMHCPLRQMKNPEPARVVAPYAAWLFNLRRLAKGGIRDPGCANGRREYDRGWNRRRFGQGQTGCCQHECQ
jgi:hypothetical protein